MLPPEIAHRVAIRAVAAYPLRVPPDVDPRLRVGAFGLSFPNPLGLAAGFDKSAEAVDGLARLGFGFIEVGTLTPLPQKGNPKPRLFRLKEDAAIINRMGFNNDGFAAAVARLRLARRQGLIGVNFGPNKDASDRVADYVRGVKTFAKLADYFTINISSPNTLGLRNLHRRGDFEPLVEAVQKARASVSPRRPILVKISPDLDGDQLDDLLTVAVEKQIDGLIVANTSVSRPPLLKSSAAKESGGLSGRPISTLSTRLVAGCYLQTKGALPIIGVGGVEDAKTAVAMIEAGATLVQIYTGLIYRGPAVVTEILRGLSAEAARRKVANISDLVGARAAELAAE
jgi:dihydroorotate dehydrogenase